MHIPSLATVISYSNITEVGHWGITNTKLLQIITLKFVASEVRRTFLNKCTMNKLIKTIFHYTVKFALGLLLSLAILNSVIEYNTWPIYTEVLVVSQKEAKYPAITMCQISNGYKEHVLQVSCVIKYTSKTYWNMHLLIIRKF